MSGAHSSRQVGAGGLRWAQMGANAQLVGSQCPSIACDRHLLDAIDEMDLPGNGVAHLSPSGGRTGPT